MRPSFSALGGAALALALGAPPSQAAARGEAPEIALLLGDVQKESVDLVAEDMLREAVRLDLGSMRVLLPYHIDRFKEQVTADLTSDPDVLEDYRRAILRLSPSDGPDADKLFAEIRRAHDLRPGPPLERVKLDAPPGGSPALIEEAGVGADVDAALQGTPRADAPDDSFGVLGAIARRRNWSVDFYLGGFADLAAHYRKLGYRRAYRLRAPGVGSGRSAYLLSPEAGLRPRLLYCGFYGQDLFLHTRAQWRTGPAAATLTCAGCAWTLPGVRAMRSLLGTVPYAAGVVVAGWTSPFPAAWRAGFLGVYENDYWRLAYFRVDAEVVALLDARLPDFGEILAASLTPMVRRGATAVYFAGPATPLEPRTGESGLIAPTDFETPDGNRLALRNVLAGRKRVLFAGLPSPLLATREWLKDAKSHGVVAFDGRMSRLAEESARWPGLEGRPVDVGIGAAVDANGPAKAQFRDAVLASLKDAARGRSR